MKSLLSIILCALLFPFLALGQATGTSGNQATQTTTEATETANDSIVVSLLTCTPGSQIYELYGHTALRVHEVNRQSDWVFNYGTFSFKQPHFLWRFVLGNTDYELGVVPYSFFYDEYVREGRGIEEQVLNLTPDEARKLVNSLSKNLEPENATYRYNFFYDNCTTRALLQIEQAVNGKVVWPKAEAGKTLRHIVHEFSATSPWDEFGQDLLLGAEADEEADASKQQFAPLYAQRFADKATIKSATGEQRPLVKATHTLLPAQAVANEAFPISPMAACGMLVAITLIISAVEWRRRKYYWAYDVVLLVAQGLAGCIIAFLFFFSHHPAVGSNWLVALFNPLPLVFFPWYMKACANGKRSVTAYVEVALIAITLVAGICGLQALPLEVYLLMLVLLARMGMHLKKTAKQIESSK